MSWNLCLTSREQGRKIVQVSSSETTTDDLYQLAAQTFDKPIASIKFGFPPKELKSSSSSSQSPTLIHTILQNQERLQIEFEASKPAKKTATKKGRKRSKPDASTSNTSHAEETTSDTTGRRPKRAAAQRATEAMPEVIRAQEALLREQSSTQKKSTSKSKSSNLHTINNRNNKSNTSKPRPNFTASVGPGRRLADGAAAPGPARGRRPKQTILGSSQSSDLSESLLGALNDSGKMGQVLRKGMKNAVQASYETSRAFSRLAAIQGQTYQLSVVRKDSANQTTSSDQGLMASIQVKYKGTVDKTAQEDSVDCLSRNVLEAVLKGIHASNVEALRPENLALLSPRVLWSLVYLYPQHTQVAAMYQDLLPDCNWNFLRRRAEQLSEKARENRRQEEEEQDTTMDMEQASQAVAAVEHAMEHLHEAVHRDRQTRQANAALQRLARATSQDEAEWKLEIPSEPDLDELRECIETGSGNSKSSKEDTDKWASQLLKDCQIHNWRELAHCKDPEHIASALGAPLNEVQSWIDVAQSKSVDEIMVEVCDQNVTAVEALMEAARSGTPKDLAVWRKIPQLLWSRLQKQNANTAITVQQLEVWCQRAHQLLQDYEWLNWYATPVA